MSIENAVRGRRNNRMGDAAEQMVMYRFSRLGLPSAHIETGWRIKRVGGRIVGATPKRPVMADILSCLPTGQMIVCEVKREESDRLNYSRLEEHQRQTLDKWQLAGALCLVAWVRPEWDILLIPWGGAPGWGLRHALPWDTAVSLNWHPSQSLTVKP